MGIGWWWIIGLIILVAVIWMVVKTMNNNSAPGKSALDILKERYASGEIDKEEFEKIKQNIL